MENESSRIDSKVLSYIGFAAGSKKLTCGTEMVLDEVRRASMHGETERIIVFLAHDASDRTKKQVRDKCSYYAVKHYETFCSDQLASAAGKRSSISALCVRDGNLSTAINKALGDKIEK